MTNGSAQAMEKDLWQHGAAWYDSCGLGSREEKHTQMCAADMQPGTWLGKGLGMVPWGIQIHTGHTATVRNVIQLFLWIAASCCSELCRGGNSSWVAKAAQQQILLHTWLHFTAYLHPWQMLFVDLDLQVMISEQVTGVIDEVRGAARESCFSLGGSSSSTFLPAEAFLLRVTSRKLDPPCIHWDIFPSDVLGLNKILRGYPASIACSSQIN